VESLLAEDDRVKSFLERPVLEFVQNMSSEDSGQSMVGHQVGSYHILSMLVLIMTLVRGFASKFKRSRSRSQVFKQPFGSLRAAFHRSFSAQLGGPG
jgi:hypothetical protein